MHIKENVALAPLTTLGVGGPARYFVEAKSEAEVRAAVVRASENGWPMFVLGGGSNLVVADRGFAGLVLKVGLTGVERAREDGKEIFDAAAGEEWDALVGRSVEEECAGIECLSGIPGTVGGTPVQNVGAYGQEVAETIVDVRVLDLRTGEIRELCSQACGFAYRTSTFNTSERGRFIVLRTRFALERGGKPKIEYRDLKSYFAGRAEPSLREVRQAVREVRQSKAMLIVEGDADARSAGSFFKNPVLTEAGYRALVEAAERRGLQVPSYPAANSQFKVPAAWLVEQAGFRKGHERGPVGISRKHALAIVNRGGASAADVVALKEEIQRGVREQFGVELTPEPVFVGFEK